VNNPSSAVVISANAVRSMLGAWVAVLAVACASAETAPPPSVPAGFPALAAGAGGNRGPVHREAADDPYPTEIGPSVRYVVRLGDMRNGSGLGGDELARVLHDSARVRARALKDAAVIDASASLNKQAADRHLPVITIDGLVTQLTESPSSGGLQVRACVEFSLRRDQVLRATVSGAATAAATSPSISDRGRRQLEDEAIDGAVLSALGAADRGFTVATR
jgi:hypothetical protein